MDLYERIDAAGQARVEALLSFEQRATWGTCPVCSALHGKPCDASIGQLSAMQSVVAPPLQGAHLGRLQNAPTHVRLVPC